MQRTASSGSFGSFDGSSASNKSVDSGAIPDAPKEKPVHSAVNHLTVASPVDHSAQLYASQSHINSSVSQTVPTRESVHHGGVHMAAVVQPPLDLFDQSVQQPVTSAASIDLSAGFNQHTPAVSHKRVELGIHSVPKETLHNVVVQKSMATSPPVPAEVLTTSHPVTQDLLSLSTLQEPSISSTSIDLFAGFNQQLPPTSSVQQSQPAAPLVADEGWAFFFDTPQLGSSTSVSNVQAQAPTTFPQSNSIAKEIDQSTLPTSPPNAFMPQSSLLMMDQWSLNAEEVKVPVSKEASQSWNAFGESSGNMPNDLFASDTMFQVVPHHFNVPSTPYAEARSPQDLSSSESERPTPGNIPLGFNVTSGDLDVPSFHGPLGPQLDGMASRPAKSTNPFDMAFESDVEGNVEGNGLFMDLTSLQATLPNPCVNTDYSGNLTESWISQDSNMLYISSGTQGGLSHMTTQVQDSLMLNSTHQGSFPPRNPFE
ncbi:hypothetical protein GUJ93_ZPchr0001g31025 [Zizania palustris]|uniref:ADP-ribosylation factor GTPase-activating protein AGD14 n=1 Tax=Zizania palustris TaxID=103762 RepID=A0A8J5RUN8_ZIZPA|nr:hypothetical protein GUJ93_ZPchr0001g31025 [Zizania palustris]